MVIGIPKRRLTRAIALFFFVLIAAGTTFVLWPTGKVPHPVYEKAMERAVAHPKVIEMLGGEISGSTPDVSETSPDSAKFEFYVFGDYGCANILAEGEMSSGEWRISSLSVEAIDGSGTQDLLR